jgi:threonine dehydrogenase-like Zn-dependent dehydrogenase
VASPANCATATGMLGLTACAMAHQTGAKHVIVIEPDARRREQALRFGANVALDSSQAREQIMPRVREVSEGRGADVGLELAGPPESLELGPPHDPHHRRLQLRARGSRKRLRISSGTSHLYPFEELVGASYPLRDVNTAIAFAETERPPRIALTP